MFKNAWNKLNPTPPPPITWASLNTPEGRARWEAAERARPPFEMDPVIMQSMIDKYMKNDVDSLTEWFRSASSQAPDKLRVAHLIAITPKPVGLSRVPDLPFIRFYLYKTIGGRMSLSEETFNTILTIDKGKFHLRSGVPKIGGGDRMKYCSIILEIKDELTRLGFKEYEYKISDQAKECQKLPRQELKDMDETAQWGVGAFIDPSNIDSGEREYVLLPSYASEATGLEYPDDHMSPWRHWNHSVSRKRRSGGRKKIKSHTKRYCKKRHTKKNIK